MQDSWQAIQELAQDASTAPAVSGESPSGHNPGAVVRRHAVSVLDAVYRNGLVPPWEIVPRLLALVTDPFRCILMSVRRLHHSSQG